MIVINGIEGESAEDYRRRVIHVLAMEQAAFGVAANMFSLLTKVRDEDEAKLMLSDLLAVRTRYTR